MKDTQYKIITNEVKIQNYEKIYKEKKIKILNIGKITV